MEAKMREASPAERKIMESSFNTLPKSDGPTLSMSDIEQVVNEPVQNLLGPHIEGVAPDMARLDLCIMKASDPVGFITSDNPCVWFDPEGYKRHPYYSGPALMYSTIEIWLPLSPSHLVFLNRRGIKGHEKISQQELDRFNRITRFESRDHYVVNSNISKDTWFDPGLEPEDSWRKRNERGEV